MMRTAGGERPRRAARRHPLGALLAWVLTAGIVLVAFAVIAVRLATAPEHGAIPPATGATPAPEAGVGEWQPPPRQWDPLPLPDPASPLYGTQVNALNAQPVPVLSGCSAPATVSTEREWEAAVRDQWHCVHRSWTPTLQRLGWPTAVPTVHFFAGEGDDSACGYLEAPAFYCSVDGGSVHFGWRHFAMARLWDLSVNEMVNHEYAHHLQNLAGVTEAKLRLAYSVDVERRAELQATCWSAAMTRRNDAVGFGADAYASWLERLESMQAGEVHGALESLMHWGTRGLYATTLNDCNTWVVPASEVA